MDAVVALPLIQKHVLKLEMFVQNDILDTHIRAMGLAVPQMTVVIIGEYANVDHVRQVSGDPTFKKLIGDVIADFGGDVGMVFSVDAVTKINRAE